MDTRKDLGENRNKQSSSKLAQPSQNVPVKEVEDTSYCKKRKNAV